MPQGSKSKKTTCPKCKTILWEWLDADRIKIIGTKARQYEIGITYIKAVCDCGEQIVAESKLIDDFFDLFPRIIGRATKQARYFIEDKNPFTLLSSNEKNKLLITLSAKQKEVFKILTEEMENPTQKIRFIGKSLFERIAIRTDTQEKEVKRHLNLIFDAITKIKPDFGKRRFAEFKTVME